MGYGLIYGGIENEKQIQLEESDLQINNVKERRFGATL